MGFLDRFKKKEEKPLKQDLTQTQEQPGAVFIMHLFMREKCEMPAKETMASVMEKYLGEIDFFCHDEKTAGFAVKKYKATFKEGTVPPQLMVTGCLDAADYSIDALTRSQMWDCENSGEILSECKYHVIAVDMLGGAMDYKNRAEMLMDYMEALVELYPACAAVQFQTSGKMFPREKIVSHQIPREDRFVYFAVNVRFFRVEGTPDFLVDTLGMSTLYLPDLQYHFHTMEPNWVVNHAYNLLSYMFANNAPIKSGETVDGVVEGRMDQRVQWKCHYESALIQPPREVLDICMNEFASGKRGY